jgi:hypothetical protein
MSETITRTSLNRSIILKTIDDDITLCEVYASYWMAMATTGIAKDRRLYHGTNGPEFTDEEKIADAMETASNHIHRMQELVDKKKNLIHEDEDEDEDKPDRTPIAGLIDVKL